MSFPFGSRAPPRRRRDGSSCNSVTISGKISENARKTGPSVPDCKTIVKSSPAPLFSPPRSATVPLVAPVGDAPIFHALATTVATNPVTFEILVPRPHPRVLPDTFVLPEVPKE